MPKEVFISIDSDGEAKIDLVGFHGKGCGKVFDDFAGDQKVTASNSKREFFESVSEQERQKQ